MFQQCAAWWQLERASCGEQLLCRRDARFTPHSFSRNVQTAKTNKTYIWIHVAWYLLKTFLISLQYWCLNIIVFGTIKISRFPESDHSFLQVPNLTLWLLKVLWDQGKQFWCHFPEKKKQHYGWTKNWSQCCSGTEQKVKLTSYKKKTRTFSVFKYVYLTSPTWSDFFTFKICGGFWFFTWWKLFYWQPEPQSYKEKSKETYRPQVHIHSSTGCDCNIRNCGVQLLNLPSSEEFRYWGSGLQVL